uniref:Uncharacterized protein n=1 Tax=Vitis vinifera TaxID=29760 RepID=F6HGA1_VITVI
MVFCEISEQGMRIVTRNPRAYQVPTTFLIAILNPSVDDMKAISDGEIIWS